MAKGHLSEDTINFIVTAESDQLQQEIHKSIMTGTVTCHGCDSDSQRDWYICICCKISISHERVIFLQSPLIKPSLFPPYF
jgi:hypothetical protein